MKQYDIFGNITLEQHPQFEDKIVNPDKYYGSELNKFVAGNCRKDMVVNNIDLIINNYKDNTLKIVESKHTNEKLATGQKILLQKLSNMGINTYVCYGDYPYEFTEVYSFQSNKYARFNKKELTEFLNK